MGAVPEPMHDMYSEFGTCLVGQPEMAVPRLTHSKIGPYPPAAQNPRFITKCAVVGVVEALASPTRDSPDL